MNDPTNTPTDPTQTPPEPTPKKPGGWPPGRNRAGGKLSGQMRTHLQTHFGHGNKKRSLLLALGLCRNQLNRFLKGTTTLSASTMDRLAAYLGLNLVRNKKEVKQ